MGTLVLTGLATLGGACARQGSSATEASQRSDAEFRQCLLKTEAEWIASKKLPDGFSCRIQDRTADQQALAGTMCTDALPRACGRDPNAAQQAYMAGNPACMQPPSGPGVTELHRCMYRRQEQNWASGAQPRSLAFGCPVFGDEYTRLVGKLAQEALFHCKPESRNFDASAWIDFQGRLVKVDVAQRPACAPSGRSEFNNDCSAMRTAQGVWRLGPVAMCRLRKELPRQQPGGVFNIGGRKIDCGYMAMEDSDGVLARECEQINRECVAEAGIPASPAGVILHTWQVGGPGDPLPPPLNGASPWTGHPGGIPAGLTQAQAPAQSAYPSQNQPQTPPQTQGGATVTTLWCNSTALRSCLNQSGGSGCFDLDRAKPECSKSSGSNRSLRVQFEPVKACMIAGTKTNAQKIACVPGI
jgi:hypothetical protein